MPYLDTGKLSLHYETVGAGGTPVLLLHELGGGSESWRAVIPILAATRRVIVVDLRNSGSSEKPALCARLEQYADDLADALAALGLDRVDVAGSAFGAIVALLLAVRHPARIRRLLLCTATDAIDDATRRYLAERATHVRAVGMRPVADASLANSFPDPHGTARRQYRPIFLANAPGAYADASLALAGFALADQDCARIAMPVLVLTGAADFIWPPAAGQRLAARIPGAEFQVLHNAGHFPHIQAPEDFSRACLAFLD